MEYKIALISGDGIGPEIVAEAKKVLDSVCQKYHHTFSYSEVLLGGASIDVHGVPLTEEAIATAKASDAVLMGSIGGDAKTSLWYKLEPSLRPEAGLLKLRKSLGLFANIRPAYLYDELKAASSFEIQKVDTYYKRRNPIKLIKDTLSCIFTTKDIIVLLSGNGMRFYFPILFFSKKVLKSRIYHDVIGGNLDQYVCEYPKFKKYLNSFEVNLVETKSMKDKLVLQGINNCEVMPNFKRLKIASIKPEEIKEPYRFCMFSRVMKEKGVEDAVKAVEQINTQNRKKICELDIFGRI